MLAYSLEHICSYSAQLQNPPEVIGPVPEGIRVNLYVTSGAVTGPKIRGILRPVGGDWLTIRTDGIGLLDVRATIETHDNALIYIAYTGVGDLGEEGYHKFLQGELPRTLPLRVVPRLHTAHPAYKWLNRMIDVKVAADITNAITYPTAVPAARKLVKPELASDTTIFPPSDAMADFFLFAPIDPDILHLITRLWLEFKAGR